MALRKLVLTSESSQPAILPQLLFDHPGERGVPLTIPPGEGTYVARWYDTEGRVVAQGYQADGACVVEVPGLATFTSGIRSGDVTVVGHGRSVDEIKVAYNRIVLPLLLQVRGLEVLHASAVLLKKGVVVLCGLSKSGKSTLAYALSRHGGVQLADDSLAWQPARVRPVAVPLPFAVQLRQESALFFDVEGDRSKSNRQVKHVEQQNIAAQPLMIVCILNQIGATHTPLVSVERIAPARAFTALLAHAHYFTMEDMERTRAMLGNYIGLARTVPSFEVSYSAGLDNLSGVIDGICDAVNNA